MAAPTISLRQSPSGPRVQFVPGSGAVLRTVLARAGVAASFSLDGTAVAEITSANRPELIDVALANTYEVEVNINLNVLDVWTTTETVFFNVQYSLDGGSNFLDLLSSNLSLLTAGFGNYPALVHYKARFLGSNISGLTEGGSLMVRVTYQKPNGPNSAIFIDASATNTQSLYVQLSELVT